ncbi:hypothetical protein [Deinococcus murrayi]|uniref:hypothetical protein n=1 Tax=Deinococcus murrayi TaxID=68910 RepID=UPI0012F8C87A|nr:hypothetical protein [Deinococcus murrayi]
MRKIAKIAWIGFCLSVGFASAQEAMSAPTQEGFYFEVAPELVSDEGFWSWASENGVAFYEAVDDAASSDGVSIGAAVPDRSLEDGDSSNTDWFWLALGAGTGVYTGIRECQKCNTSQMVRSVAYHGAIGVVGGGKAEIGQMLWTSGRKVVGFVYGAGHAAGAYELGNLRP